MNTKTPTVANHIVNAVLSHVRNNKDPLLTTLGEDKEGRARHTARVVGQKPAQPTESTFNPNADTSILHVGLDWGASKTSVKASFAGSSELLIDETIPTVVGFAKEGILDAVLPNNATTLFGHEALTHRRHLHLTQPTIDSAAATEFGRHLRARIGQAGAEIRAVIGVPANADPVMRDNIRHNLSEHFKSVILLPQPFLAALGYRDESRLVDPDYIDPIRNSIFIDLGASATNLCLVQGYYPTADEQIALNFGGNSIDDLLRSTILQNYPEAELSPITIRLLKEKHSFVGKAATPIHVNVIIAGKPNTLDLTNEINAACAEALTRTVEALKELLAQTESELSESSSLPQIILTGGGSRIKNFGDELQRILMAEGFARLHVTQAGENYKQLVASGALKVARQAREHQWQQVLR